MTSSESASLDLVRDALKSWRWADEGRPGSAQIKPLHERISNPEQYLAFKQTEAGTYLCQVADALDECMNDDWLPEQMFGLSLALARQFLSYLASALESGDFSAALPSLRAKYQELSGES
jgi:hypothetical protein